MIRRYDTVQRSLTGTDRGRADVCLCHTRLVENSDSSQFNHTHNTVELVELFVLRFEVTLL